MPKRKKHVKQAQAAVNQSAIASNTLANPQPTHLLTNQNLQNSAASAAALPRLQHINSTSTNANIYTSHSEAMDTSHSVSSQVSQPALQINSSSSSQPGPMDISESTISPPVNTTNLEESLHQARELLKTRLRDFGESIESVSDDNNMRLILSLQGNVTLDHIIDIFQMSGGVKAAFVNLLQMSYDLTFCS